MVANLSLNPFEKKNQLPQSTNAQASSIFTSQDPTKSTLIGMLLGQGMSTNADLPQIDSSNIFDQVSKILSQNNNLQSLTQNQGINFDNDALMNLIINFLMIFINNILGKNNENLNNGVQYRRVYNPNDYTGFVGGPNNTITGPIMDYENGTHEPDMQKFNEAAQNISGRITDPRLKKAFGEVCDWLRTYDEEGGDAQGRHTKIKNEERNRIMNALISGQNIINIQMGDLSHMGSLGLCEYDGTITIDPRHADCEIKGTLAHEIGHFSAIGTSFWADENRAWAIGESILDDYGQGDFDDTRMIENAASYGWENHSMSRWIEITA